ncbi:protein FATTY ACID EXPORT 3, chloroplastic-like isoform X2 [Salvia splendens]|uniref:protein FATTY ACID EXPORT 3, chloroplastic-like isoform X2 n=1 Tax=Salvia splendens TaxID=180675 RepID=UPI001C25D8D3|nr:protein FATTY ACID EXPORT 3, chloroplastic-like isoform X2 [Salvia splendens]
MSVRLESIKFRNSFPNINRPASTMALCHSPPTTLGFQPLLPPKINVNLSLPRLLGVNLRQITLRNRTVFSFAASHEESPSDIGIEKEKEDLKGQAQESEEAWQQVLSSFKEQAIKMQSMSKEAYELYSEKAFVVLKETSEKLKIQAEKARQDLVEIAKETAEESKEYLAAAAEKSPEPVKDIVETFSTSTDELNDVSKVRDFYVGIPYGALLSVGGFLSFMLTGSIHAIRFGIVLGGTLLALSIASLKSWKKGEPSSLLVKGQTVIATIFFVRELRLLAMRSFISNFITTLISGGVLAFYLYRIIRDREQTGGSSQELGAET